MQELLHDPIINLPLGAGALANGVTQSPLALILPLIAALVLSMVVIPIMVRLAPRLGMLDQPDARKVHATPIPRVGGVGIFIGAMVPVVLLLPIDQTLMAFIWIDIAFRMNGLNHAFFFTTCARIATFFVAFEPIEHP